MCKVVLESGTQIFSKFVLSDFAYPTGFGVHSLQIQTQCHKANHIVQS